MSATSALENEDIENVPLVRMEDVQPERYEDAKTEKIDAVKYGDAKEVEYVKVEYQNSESEDSQDLQDVQAESVEDDNFEIVNDVVIRDEVLETCVVDSVGSDCVVNDEDGNVVVTIHAEVFDGDSAEITLPALEPPLRDDLELTDEIENVPNHLQPKANMPGSWPTLEILPGGVIKHADKCDNDLATLTPAIDKAQETSEQMRYVCAKCSQSFKYLFCLVKHVKWHEEQQKKAKGRDVPKITGKNYVCLHSNKRKIISKLKSRCKIPKS